MTANLPPESHRLAPDRHPTPFSGEQIRDASPPGTRVAFRVEQEGEDPVIERWEFVSVGQVDGTRRRWTQLPDGTVIDGPAEETSTWLSLQAHASYRADTTTLTAGVVEIPMGSFEGWIYTIRNDDGSVTTASFAHDFPGPPVLMETVRKGEVVFRMTLIERTT